MRVRHPVAVLVAMCATALPSHPALAQFSQQGQKLVAVGAVGNAAQGFSVALSGGGNTAIIGGNNDSGQTGAAWIWTRSGGIWTEGIKLAGADATGPAQQGYSVGISNDGLTAIVGGPADDTTTGAAWIWARSGGDWTQQAKLVAPDAVGRAQQGWSVALSADGSTALIGGRADNSFAGAAWVWTRNGGLWSEQGKLAGAGAIGVAEQGGAVSLSADGNTAIVGGSFDNGQTGAAWIWTRSGGVWTQQGAKLSGSGATGAASQGRSVAISADGNTAAVGGPADNGYAGAVWIWTRGGGVWTQSTKLIGLAAVGNAQQGSSVALSSDGNAAIVGGLADNSYAGAAWAWRRAGGVWTQQSAKLFGSGTTGNAEQGAAAALSADGSTAILGGYFDNGQAGAAWVFAAAESPPATCPAMTPANVFITYHDASNGCNTGQVCPANDLLTFNAQSFGYDFGCANHSFSWSGSGGWTGTGRQITHGFTLPGSYSVTLTITNSQQVYETSITIVVSSIQTTKRRAVAPPSSAAAAAPVLLSLGSNQVLPLQPLTLSGSGFDGAAATTSVNFSDAGGYYVTAPAIVINPATALVSVPPYVSPATHLNGTGTVSVKVVVQTAGGATLNSNTVNGLLIGQLPAVTLPPGTVTANLLTFLQLSLGQVRDDLLNAEASSNGQLSLSGYRAKLDDEIAKLSAMEGTIRSAIAGFAASPGTGANTSSGMPATAGPLEDITFDQPALRSLDQTWTSVIQSNTTVSGAPLSKGGIECYTLLKNGLDAVLTEAKNARATVQHQLDTAKALGGCAQMELQLASQFGAGATLALLAMRPAMSAAIAAFPEAAPVPGLLGLAALGVQLYLLCDARDIACEANRLFPDREARQTCIEAKEQIAETGIEADLGYLVGILKSGHYAVDAYEAISAGYELIPESKETVVQLQATNLWPGVRALSCTPGVVTVGSHATCTVTIGFAPLTTTVVTLTSDHPNILAAPPSVTLGENADSGTFTVTGVAEGTATITAGGGQTTGRTPTTMTVTAPSSGVSCTYVYSDWSACHPDGSQSRTLISRTPSGCIDDPPPVLIRGCVYIDNTCYTSYFDAFCTAFGPGGCWRCHTSAYVNGVCPSPFAPPYFSLPGPCDCDPHEYVVCQ